MPQARRKSSVVGGAAGAAPNGRKKLGLRTAVGAFQVFLVAEYLNELGFIGITERGGCHGFKVQRFKG